MNFPKTSLFKAKRQAFSLIDLQSYLVEVKRSKLNYRPGAETVFAGIISRTPRIWGLMHNAISHFEIWIPGMAPLKCCFSERWILNQADLSFWKREVPSSTPSGETIFFKQFFNNMFPLYFFRKWSLLSAPKFAAWGSWDIQNPFHLQAYY